MATKNQRNESTGVFDRIESNVIDSVSGDLVISSKSGTISTIGNIVPSVDNVYRIGTGSKQFQSLTSRIYYTPSSTRFSLFNNMSGSAVSVPNTGAERYIPLKAVSAAFDDDPYVKFPSKGLYLFHMLITYNQASPGAENRMDFKLGLVGSSQASYFERTITQPSTLSSTLPQMLTNRWVVLNSGDRVQLLANVLDNVTVTNVYVLDGFVVQLETWE